MRQITQIIGNRSSRSGLRIIDGLIERDLVFRDGTGKLQVKSTVVACDTCSPGQKGTKSQVPKEPPSSKAFPLCQIGFCVEGIILALMAGVR